MDFDQVAAKLDRFLYRRTLQGLSLEDLQTAETWCLDIIRREHPHWTEDQVRRYYDGLRHVRTWVVDRWGNRL